MEYRQAGAGDSITIKMRMNSLCEGIYMKFLHTADLHIGKKIFELSLIEDQKYILNQMVDIAVEEQVDAVVIAGDVYDRAVPSTEAVSLLDDFLTRLQEKGIPVIMISGNHDSPERVAFADAILEKQGLYIAGNYQSPLKTVVLEDAYGPVYFVCMPFVKPAIVGATNSAEAVENMLSAQPMTLSLRQRYVLVAHYFVTGENGETPELSDSETDVNVGGLDNVPADYFRNFCYVALGHIHKPQHIGAGQVHYSGSPLKYSFSEARGVKSVNIVELNETGVERVSKRELKPLREMRCIKGKLHDLMNPEIVAENVKCDSGYCAEMQTDAGEQVGEGGRDRVTDDYLQITLTNEEELIDPMGTLRSVYPNVLQLLLEKNLTPEERTGNYESKISGNRKSTTELFAEFYEMLKGEPLDEKRLEVVREVAEEVEEA